MKALDLDTHLDAELGVEVREGLVEQKALRVAHDRAAQRHPLALPAGELLGLALEQRHDPEQVGALANARLDGLLRRPTHGETERHVLVDGHVRIERVALEHHRDVAIFGWHVVHDAAGDEDVAPGRALEARDHPEGGRLAAPRRPDENDELARAHLESSRTIGFCQRLVHRAQRNVSQSLLRSLRGCSAAPRERDVHGTCAAIDEEILIAAARPLHRAVRPLEDQIVLGDRARGQQDRAGLSVGRDGPARAPGPNRQTQGPRPRHTTARPARRVALGAEIDLRAGPASNNAANPPAFAGRKRTRTSAPALTTSAPASVESGQPASTAPSSASDRQLSTRASAKGAAAAAHCARGREGMALLPAACGPAGSAGA